MKNEINIKEIYNKLAEEYPDAGYVSYATVFNRAMWDGKISEQVRDRASDYYGRLWNYVGD